MISKVVILDCNRNGLASIRSLGSQGIEVIALDHGRTKVGIYSRYVGKHYFIPKPHKDPNGFVDAVLRVGKKEGAKEKIALLPVNDEYVRVLAENWDRLSEYFIPLFETNVSTLERVGNKLDFSEFAKEAEVPQPKRYTEKDIVDGNCELPIIIKPDERRSVENLQKGIFKVRYCESIDQARSAVKELNDANCEGIYQQFIPGGDDTLYTAGTVSVNGQLIGCFTGRKVRQFPPNAGQATLAESIEDQKLIEYANRIVRALNYTGIAQIEFKAWNDELYVIEMNPRSWSWHGLAKQAGVDLPYLLYSTVVQGAAIPSSPATNKVNGVTWYYFLEDLIYNNLLHGSISWGEMWRSFQASKAHAFFDRNDALPWLIHMLFDVPLRLFQYFFGRKRKIDTA